MFVAPSWIEGFLVQFGLYIVIPLIVGVIVMLGLWKRLDDVETKLITVGITFGIVFAIMIPVTSVVWFNMYEVPSVQEKIITVHEWQPKAGLSPNSEGLMTINNADQLMMITTNNEGFLNEENFYFQKFNTRDIFNTLKVGGTYKIKYYGWREGFNSGFPNILSVEEVINETGAKENAYSDYFGTKLTK